MSSTAFVTPLTDALINPNMAQKLNIDDKPLQLGTVIPLVKMIVDVV